MKSIGTLFFALAASCLGQAAAPPNPIPSSAQAIQPLRLGKIVGGGSFRSRVEGFNWFQPFTGDNAYAYSGNILRVSVSQRRETWDWNAEFAVPFLLGLPGNPVAPGAQGALGLGANYFRRTAATGPPR